MKEGKYTLGETKSKIGSTQDENRSNFNYCSKNEWKVMEEESDLFWNIYFVIFCLDIGSHHISQK